MTDSAVQGLDRKSVIITSALPYANGEIHLGHISSTYLPADIIRRFLKLNGVEVYHLCASDDFGTPVLIQTEKMNMKPESYVKYWHDKAAGLQNDREWWINRAGNLQNKIIALKEYASKLSY